MSMASSPASSSTKSPQEKYDVFLSFRGADTRANITSHLYSALGSKQIETYMDDCELRRGDKLSESLPEAIETSLISVVILSKNYADSKWCLRELDKMLECKKKYGRIVIPIFYHVDPTDVRKQTGSYGVALTKHKRKNEGGPNELQRWRDALTEVADIAGWNFSVSGNEAVLTDKIVNDVRTRLNGLFSSDAKNNFVGLDSRVGEIEGLLKHVCSVGIWGLGGIGKTTLAMAVFNKISNDFDAFYFVDKIMERERTTGLIGLQEKIFSKILNDRSLNMSTPGPLDNNIKRRLRRKKVLIVLDDVTRAEQIESLIGGFDWFGSKSRFIIISRDKRVLDICEANRVYKVAGLPYDDALKLFSLHAFRQNQPPTDYVQLSDWVVNYMDGVPLALKTFGSHLYDRPKQDMEDAVDKLKIIPYMEIQDVLRISYDGLEYQEQQILLDVACLYNQDPTRKKVRDILAASGTDIGLAVLAERCLIDISEEDTLKMHDLVRQMAREIVRQESITNPGRRSRLFDPADIFEVLKNDKGTETIQGISLDLSTIKEVDLNPQAFTKMENLRLLNFYESYTYKNNVSLSLGLVSISTNLRYFSWTGLRLESLPPNINFENLVELHMPHCEVEKLWDGVQSLPSLKHLDIRGSRLETLPDLSLAQNLESLDMRACSYLVEVHPSVQHLNKLVYLNLRGCYTLTSLPTLTSLESLEKIYLSSCRDLKIIPDLPPNVRKVCLAHTNIEALPSSFGCLSRLEDLNLLCCKLTSLPTLTSLESLEKLCLSVCFNFKIIPDLPSNVTNVDLSSTNIEALPSSLGCLSRLECLDLRKCFMLKCLPDNISECKSLKRLILDSCSELDRLPEDFGNLEELDELDACGMVALQKLPSSFVRLKKLSSLDCSGSSFAKCHINFGHLSSLHNLVIPGAHFKVLPKCIVDHPCLRRLDISCSEMLENIPDLPVNLHLLKAHECKSLRVVSGLRPLFHEISAGRNWNLNPNHNSDNDQYDFVNCVKLDSKRLEDAMERALLNTRFETAQIPARVIRYPGSEVPEWFMFQGTGSSMTFDLEPGWFSENFIGFLLCAVVKKLSLGFISLRIYIHCECKLICNDGSWINVDIGAIPYTSALGSLPDCDMDHVFIGVKPLDKPEHFHKYQNFNKASVQFSLRGFYKNLFPSGSLEVKKCGIHRLYTKGSDEEPQPEMLNSSLTEEPQHEMPNSSSVEEPQPEMLKSCFSHITERFCLCKCFCL